MRSTFKDDVKERTKAAAAASDAKQDPLFHKLPDSFQAEETLPHAFTVLSNRISLTLQQVYRQRFGLSVVGWRLIGVLGVHSPLSAKELSEITVMDQVSISRAVDQLVSKKLLSRRIDQTDRRRVEIRLTKRGMAVYEQVIPVFFAAEKALLSGLAEDETILLRSIMKKLVVRSAEVLGTDSDWHTVLSRFGYGSGNHDSDR